MPEKPLVSSHVAVPRAQNYQSIVLRLNRVHCESTTGEIGRDEIVLGTTKFHAQMSTQGGKGKLSAKASRGEILHLGKFKKGETRTFENPKDLARFPFGAGNLPWPRRFVASIALIEKDGGQLGKLLDQLASQYESQLKDFSEEIMMSAGAAIGGALGSAIPVPLVGTALGTVAGAAIEKGIALLRNAKNDDLIEVDRVSLKLEQSPANKGVLKGERDVVTFTGRRAKYVLTFTWEVE